MTILILIEQFFFLFMIQLNLESLSLIIDSSIQINKKGIKAIQIIFS
jgi:hypothetical protein